MAVIPAEGPVAPEGIENAVGGPVTPVGMVTPGGSPLTPDGGLNPAGGPVAPEGIERPAGGPVAPVGVPVAPDGGRPVNKVLDNWESTDVGGSAVPERMEAGGAPLWLAITPGGKDPPAVTWEGGPPLWPACWERYDIARPNAKHGDPKQRCRNDWHVEGDTNGLACVYKTYALQMTFDCRLL